MLIQLCAWDYYLGSQPSILSLMPWAWHMSVMAAKCPGVGWSISLREKLQPWAVQPNCWYGDTETSGNLHLVNLGKPCLRTASLCERLSGVTQIFDWWIIWSLELQSSLLWYCHHFHKRLWLSLYFSHKLLHALFEQISKGVPCKHESGGSADKWGLETKPNITCVLCLMVSDTWYFRKNEISYVLFSSGETKIC